MIDRRKDMNIVETGAESLAANPAPLFASSWMALFLLIREQWLDGGRETPAPLAAGTIEGGTDSEADQHSRH
jgi:hypothetical protein